VHVRAAGPLALARPCDENVQVCGWLRRGNRTTGDRATPIPTRGDGTVRDTASDNPPEGLRVVRVDGSAGRSLTIELVGRLDIETTERFDRGIREAIARHPSRIVVDFRRVSHLDSSGLRTLILAQRAAEGHDVELCLVPGTSHVRRILRTTGVAGRFRLLEEPTRAES
jgi:anti-anti-sigma factor